MEAIRETIFSKTENLTITIPKAFTNKKLEVLVFPLPSSDDTKDNKHIIPMLNAVNKTNGCMQLDRDEAYVRIESCSWQMGKRKTYNREDLHAR